MRQLNDSDFDVIDLRPYSPPPPPPYPQLTELLAGICVVALLVFCTGYITAFSYRFIAQQQLGSMN